MRNNSVFCIVPLILLAVSILGETPSLPQMDESSLLHEFQVLWEKEDNERLPLVIRQLADVGSSNAVETLLPHLDYNPAIYRARKGGSRAVVTTVGNRFVVAETVEKIGIPLERCLEYLEQSAENSIEERLLVHIGVANHRAAFCSNMICRANTDGGRWLHVEHLCIPAKVAPTNGWPASILLSQVDSGLVVTITNHLASPLSIPGTPLSVYQNTLNVFHDSAHPQWRREFGSTFDHTLLTRPTDWFATIPPKEGLSFSVSWNDITNSCPQELWNSAWQIQWSFRDDLGHEFLSNPLHVAP